MTQFECVLSAGEDDNRTVVVGVKLDGASRELLTWALVKVAQPGDRVIALHVLNNNGSYPLLLDFLHIQNRIFFPCFETNFFLR